MKRVTKFRGKDIETGQWVYGDLLQNGSICHISNFDNGVNREHYEVDPDTVGQFTGMTNDQGVELYEGDRYKWPNGKGGEVGEIIFEDGMFCCKSPYKTFALNSMNIYCEVIGTIHDTKPAT